MKLKNGFVMRKIAGKDVVLPCGDEMNLNQMITLNESGLFLWNSLQEETTEDAVINALAERYQIPTEEAKNHTLAFIEKLRSYHFLED